MSVEGRTFLVTGGAGFIGSHLTDRLLSDGARVRVLDDLSTGKRQNLASAEGTGRLELLEADLIEPGVLDRAVAGVEAVFHQAALGSVPRSVKEPLRSHEVNATGTLALLVAAQAAGVDRVVFASSSSVYGDTPELPKVETMLPRPQSPYATTKIAGEYYCRVFASVHGMKTVSLRYFNVFGPRQDPSSQYAAVIPRFMDALRRGEAPVVYGDGTQSRDFTFVSDVVEANLCALRAPEAAWGAAFNVANGRRVTLLDLLDRLASLAGVPVAPRFDPPRSGDVKHSEADARQARTILGWDGRVGMDDGLAKTFGAFMESR